MYLVYGVIRKANHTMPHSAILILILISTYSHRAQRDVQLGCVSPGQCQR